MKNPFKNLRRKYTIDDIVYLSEGDRRLALNLDKAHSMEILYKHIQKNNSLRLSEIEKNIFNESICVRHKGKILYYRD